MEYVPPQERSMGKSSSVPLAEQMDEAMYKEDDDE